MTWQIELARLLNWRRLGAGALVLAVVSWVTAENLAGLASSRGFSINQWDVTRDLLNNYALVTWILLPLIVALTGDVLTQDRRSGHSALVLTRTTSRGRWWSGKLMALLLFTLSLFAMLFAISAIVGAFFTDPGWGLSEYGQISHYDPFSGPASASKAYGAPPLTQVPVAGIAIETLYAAVTVWALAAVILSVSQLWLRPWTPLAVTFVACFVFWQVTPTTILHPLIHLFWDAHNFSITSTAIEWWATAVVVASELAVAVGLGTAILHNSDV